MFVVGRKVNVSIKVEGGEKGENLRGEVIRRIIKMNAKVASDDEFMRGGSSKREEGMEVLKKKKFGWENGDDGGRVCYRHIF